MADLSDQYNTELSEEDEKTFQRWATSNRRDKDSYDYDMRGWWSENKDKKLPGGGEHFTDKYKKPNHPTFSDESQYHGKDGNEGGKWGGSEKEPTFTPSKKMLEQTTPQDLRAYFDKVEPEVTLVLPEEKTRADRWYGAQE
jgi:hypothetical protein